MSSTTHLLDQRHALIDLRAARDVLTDHHLSTTEIDARIDALAQATVQIAVRCLSCRTRLVVQEPVDGTSVPHLVLCADCDIDEATAPFPQSPFATGILVPVQQQRQPVGRRADDRHLSVVPLPWRNGESH